MSQTDKSIRKSVRLPGYDYSFQGAYYVTICTNNRFPYFGKIHDYKIALSRIGMIVEHDWMSIPKHFAAVGLYEFAVMPDHVHGIVELTTQDHSLASIIGGFKAGVTRLCRQNELVDNEKLWQRGYFEHIVSTEQSLRRIRQYIIDNPIQWELDKPFPF
jgi:REP element-mobilizing transposase RayT